MLDHTAPIWPSRLTAWLEQFETCFSHRAQQGGLRRYVRGVLSDSPRKSMEAMRARLSDPGSYHALHHFITEATWSANAVWRRLREVTPAREGVLIIDGTGFPKQGKAWVGVQRQYSGTLGKVGSCQVAVTAALWTGVHAWLLGAQLYLPESWLTKAQRTRARIPGPVVFHEKWRQALTLVRQVRAAGFVVTAVAADAEFGDGTTFRETLHRWGLAYAVGLSSTIKVFRGTPRLVSPPPQPGRGRPRSRDRPHRRGTGGAGARFWACRATPAHDWRERRVAPKVWLLCQRPGGDAGDEVLHRPPPDHRLAEVARASHASALGN